MTEYIEREAIQKRLNRIVEVNNLRTDLAWFTPYGVKALIEEIPAADVRPVVLCKDCQDSYEWANVDGDNYRYCGYLRSRWNHDIDRMVDDDDFCKWGRKREES